MKDSRTEDLAAKLEELKAKATPEQLKKLAAVDIAIWTARQAAEAIKRGSLDQLEHLADVYFSQLQHVMAPDFPSGGVTRNAQGVGEEGGERIIRPGNNPGEGKSFLTRAWKLPQDGSDQPTDTTP